MVMQGMQKQNRACVMRDRSPDSLNLTVLGVASSYVMPAIASDFRWFVGVFGEIKNPAVPWALRV